jgi:putative ABC transport system substrate-binding protein
MRKLVVSGIVLVVLTVGSRLLPYDAGAAEGARPFRIGGLTWSWGPTPAIDGLRDGLIARGYHEYEDFEIGVRFTQGDMTALPAAARALVQLGADLIFTHDETTSKAAQRATSQIPIVFAAVEDPVGSGLVKSFARPGANITGVASLDLMLGPKRLEIFREIVPTLKRVLYPHDPGDAAAVAATKVFRDAARRLGIELVERTVQTEAEAQMVLGQIRKGDVDGILTPRCCSLNIPGFAIEAASQQGIPIMTAGLWWVKERGGLASYGMDSYASGRQAARLVDKIIKGAKPTDLPVETLTKIELVINLKTAEALGLTIPPEVLYRADRIIR